MLKFCTWALALLGLVFLFPVAISLVGVALGLWLVCSVLWRSLRAWRSASAPSPGKYLP